MRYPSVKNIRRIAQGKVTEENIRLIRNIMTGKNRIVHDVIETYCFEHREALKSIAPNTEKWLHSCHNMPSLHYVKMEIFNELLKGYGVEYIPKGHNAKSPSIEYVNFSDTYIDTLLYINGRYIIGNWGYYVERGNYD
jgi:hypothetical protein